MSHKLLVVIVTDLLQPTLKVQRFLWWLRYKLKKNLLLGRNCNKLLMLLLDLFIYQADFKLTLCIMFGNLAPQLLFKSHFSSFIILSHYPKFQFLNPRTKVFFYLWLKIWEVLRENVTRVRQRFDKIETKSFALHF